MGSNKNISQPAPPFLPTIQVFTDLLSIFAGLYITHISISNTRTDDTSLLVGLLLLVNYYISSIIISNNHSWRMRTITKECFRCARVWSVSFLITIFTVNLLDSAKALPSEQIASYYIFSTIFLVSSRIASRLILNYIRVGGKNQKRVAILGQGGAATDLRDTFIEHAWMGVSFRGFFFDSKDQNDTAPQKYKRSGSSEKLVRLCKARLIDEVYITLPMKEEKLIKSVLKDLSDSSVPVYIVPDIFTFSLLHSRWRDVHGIPVVGVYDTPLKGSGTAIKRLEDVILATIILSLICIPLVAIAIGIKLTSPGPVLFKQRRYGYGGKEVEVWKFRTMTVCENEMNVKQATKNDPRVTSFGRFLRRTSLDELPQFINVLQGHMSIVGPRPHAVAHNEQYRKDINGYMLRHLVKPGITGWAQINGWRGETDTLEKMQRRVDYDLDYIKNWSLNLDIKIIVTTIFKGFTGKQAY
ncbi:undecaprenyl-phosphate glucose phosphotransferase [Saccharophagus degradans]|uniref:Undecaprenyl-phosphate glucose phosphotransferase n=1 Tax=Saccharophagus degradans TaxID=86304 RepID=A0AAW7X0M7_9GAMM|nr:undecaprenyl-phosphate glucose phosphotransferase [Saccharophagus degradans]MDO6421064.1 undecaprenyl-phosphate glucose phosphotransferase [Saccharophagus degradans]MDO6606025.1 undecaprenyl-phosphate glucose phosphotransferase [Saccharophagus degradans]